jgi:hypothetical protein
MRGATKKLQKASKPVKQAVKKAQPVKKAQKAPARSSSGGKSGGWLGGAGGAENLDKWYGVFRAPTSSNQTN